MIPKEFKIKMKDNTNISSLKLLKTGIELLKKIKNIIRIKIIYETSNVFNPSIKLLPFIKTIRQKTTNK